jgi:hypothetical protein
MSTKFFAILFFITIGHWAIGQRVILNVPEIRQLRTNWCWAASAEMIDKFHSNNASNAPSQCDIVTQYLESATAFDPELGEDEVFSRTVGNCCQTCFCDNTQTANFTIPYLTSPSVFIGVTYHSVFLDLGYYSTMDKGLKFADIKEEIMRCMPIILGVEYSGGGQHIMVVKGVEKSQLGEILHLNDPTSGQCGVSFLNAINLTAISNPASITKVQYYIAGIRGKNRPLCDTCSRYINNPFQENTELAQPQLRKIEESFDELVNRLEKQPSVKIPVTYLAFNRTRNKRQAVTPNDLFLKETDFYFYQGNTQNVLTKQNIEGKEVVTQLKTSNYPLVFSILDGNEIVEIDLINDKRIRVELFKVPGPLYQDFVFVKKEKGQYLLSVKDLNVNKGKPTVPINKNMFKLIFRDGIKVDNQFMTKNNVFRKLREQLKVWKRSWLLKN